MLWKPASHQKYKMQSPIGQALSPRSGRHIHSEAAASEGVASERSETRSPEPLVNEKNNQSPDVRSGRQPVTASCLGGASAETEGRKPGDGKVRP